MNLHEIIGPVNLSAWWADWGVPVLAFLIASLAFWLIARLWMRRPATQKTEAELLDEPPGPGPFGPFTEALAAQIPESQKERKDFQLLLRQAGLYHPAARNTIYALRFVLLIVPVVIAGVWAVLADEAHTWKIVGGGLLAGATLSIVPRLYVFFRRRRRMQEIRRGLPDTLDMLSMCFTGGLGLSESLQHVATQLGPYPALAQELTILRRQAEVGSLKLALADLAVRVNLPEVRQLANLLTRGTRLGTQLAGSLNDQADHLRIARKQAATRQANKTPVKLVFPILFAFAPAALILLTAPAVLELRDFLVPEPQSAVTAQPGQSFGTQSMIRVLEGLEQRIDPYLPGTSPDPDLPF